MVAVSDPIAIGEITGTAYDGAKGKANADAIAALKENTVNGQKLQKIPLLTDLMYLLLGILNHLLEELLRQQIK